MNVRYGDAGSQVCDLYLPDGIGPHPVVILLHGGFWRVEYDRSLMAPLAADLVAGGWAAWNVEYRRVGESGGGWPGTFEDVGTALDALCGLDPKVLDLNRVVAVGHSAGGHLALWAASRPSLPAGAPGSGPRLALKSVVAQSAVCDLRVAARSASGRAATFQLMGCDPDEDPDRYAIASPIERLPLGVPQLLVHGDADHIVPLGQSERYFRHARRAGDPVELLALRRVGHFDLINPKHRSWRAVAERLHDLGGDG